MPDGHPRSATTVLVVDDQPLIRQGIRAVLRGQPGVEVVGEAHDGHSAVRTARRLRPDVTLMDVQMPGMDGVEATRVICADDDPPTSVVVLTMYDQDEHVFEALRAGARGLVLKDAPTSELVAAIHAAAAGDSLLSPSVTRRLIEEFARRPTVRMEATDGPAELTARERDVFRLLVQGLSTAEAAERLTLGDSTVKSHVQSLYRKLGVRDRVQAVIYAYEHGLVDRTSPPPGGGTVPRGTRVLRSAGDDAWRPAP
ncbi:two component transcriptional regulator, LuxR family [Cellulomonas flavigena DSM 20109]|uniref:Two component transcriptional regulator, LuxR family n=1 Tax=Cellulomonas flavigena (strain ATCC 482 / DSM 20109 / BCRC 11376 / JCM 18109 / NBRC 3775 / NCIMB 8073 / NRS 134) TaxID=446466 RepID=D5UC57_CELFN|nr:two component transcriptional regulator, LuxR family [Cellulomonas flavigena DSM 20109]